MNRGLWTLDSGPWTLDSTSFFVVWKRKNKQTKQNKTKQTKLRSFNIDTFCVCVCVFPDELLWVSLRPATCPRYMSPGVCRLAYCPCNMRPVQCTLRSLSPLNVPATFPLVCAGLDPVLNNRSQWINQSGRSGQKNPKSKNGLKCVSLSFSFIQVDLECLLLGISKF